MKMIDNYWEHSQHDKYDPKCSSCYSEKRNRKINKEDEKIDWDLLSERSAHPENDYW